MLIGLGTWFWQGTAAKFGRGGDPPPVSAAPRRRTACSATDGRKTAGPQVPLCYSKVSHHRRTTGDHGLREHRRNEPHGCERRRAATQKVHVELFDAGLLRALTLTLRKYTNVDVFIVDTAAHVVRLLAHFKGHSARKQRCDSAESLRRGDGHITRICSWSTLLRYFHCFENSGSPGDTDATHPVLGILQAGQLLSVLECAPTTL